MPSLCGLQLQSLFCSILFSAISGVEITLHVLTKRHDVTVIMRVCVYCRMAPYLQGQVKESRRMEGEIWIDPLPGRVMLERSHCGPTISRPLSVHLPNTLPFPSTFLEWRSVVPLCNWHLLSIAPCRSLPVLSRRAHAKERPPATAQRPHPETASTPVLHRMQKTHLILWVTFWPHCFICSFSELCKNCAFLI